jgi:TonB family protein
MGARATVVGAGFLALLGGCAGGGTRADDKAEPWMSDFDPLDVVELMQDVPDSLKLVAIAASFGDKTPGKCPHVRPIRVDLTYQDAGGQESRLGTEVRCGWATRGARVPMGLQVKGSSITDLVARQVTGDPNDPSLVEVQPHPPDAGMGPVRAEELPSKQTPVRQLSMVVPVIPKAVRQVKTVPRYGVKVCVRRDGTVGRVSTSADSRDPQIDAAVLDAIRRWRFQAATLHGRPLQVCQPIALRP